MQSLRRFAPTFRSAVSTSTLRSCYKQKQLAVALCTATAITFAAVYPSASVVNPNTSEVTSSPSVVTFPSSPRPPATSVLASSPALEVGSSNLFDNLLASTGRFFSSFSQSGNNKNNNNNEDSDNNFIMSFWRSSPKRSSEKINYRFYKNEIPYVLFIHSIDCLACNSLLMLVYAGWRSQSSSHPNCILSLTHHPS